MLLEKVELMVVLEIVMKTMRKVTTNGREITSEGKLLMYIKNQLEKHDEETYRLLE